MRDRAPSPPTNRGGTTYTAVGRRKRSVARVLIQPGNGNIIVNGIPLEQRFPRGSHQPAVAFHHRTATRLDHVRGEDTVATPVRSGDGTTKRRPEDRTTLPRDGS